VGINTIEAMILACAGETAEEVSDDDFDEILTELTSSRACCTPLASSATSAALPS
jgi:hypothetical protein